jgi:hypothetical protein
MDEAVPARKRSALWIRRRPAMLFESVFISGLTIIQVPKFRLGRDGGADNNRQGITSFP